MSSLIKGEITTWNDEKGFGFISPIRGGDRIFFHIKAFKNRSRRPQIHQKVAYSLSHDKQGRTCAAEVTYIGKESASKRQKKAQAGAFVFVTMFFAALGILTFIMQMIPIFIIALYAVASAVTFFTYAIDKSAARHGRWRTAEATLHMLSLFGGWPGALIAQQTLRHKSRKHGFQWVFKFTVVVNVAVTAWLLTPRGPELTMAFLEKLETMIK